MNEKACDSYKLVIDGGEGSFVELSMLNFAKLSYALEKWDDAYGGYASLYESAKLGNNTYVALAGMMRSAFKGHDWEKAITGAENLIADERSADDRVEAEYVKAKSYLATSRRDEAMALLEKLSADKVGKYGAEAAYILIHDSYDRGEFEKVENQVYNFADAGSGQTYWLAKSFIVLGDSFADRGEFKQAKATFESIRDGYSGASGGDDILEDVNLRLLKLDAIMNSKN